MAESVIDKTIRLARKVQPDLWDRTEGVARIIDPSAFADDWIIDPPSAAKLHALRLEVLRGNAMSKAHEILRYLGVNVDTDWYEILDRLAKER